MPASEPGPARPAPSTPTGSAAERRLKVLFVTRKWPPAVGGMETYCVELAEELKAAVELEVLALPGRRKGDPPGLLALLAFFARAAWHLARQGGRYDVLHLSDLVLAPLARLNRAMNPKCRNVISAHGTDIAFGLRRGWKPALYRRFLGWMARHRDALDAVVANSRATRRHCERAGLDRVVVVPLATRSTSAAPAAVPPEPYVLFVGRLVRRKGAGWFIREVLPRLPEEITLKIAGTLWDPDEGSALESPRVAFLGPVFGAELAELRRRAIAVIMPNVPLGGRDFEGFGLTALEAAADGGVLLASGIDGIVDAVADGRTGFLLEPEKPALWVERILEVRDWSGAQRQAFLAGARDTVRDQFCWSRVAAETIGVYRRACDRRRRRRKAPRRLEKQLGPLGQRQTQR